MNTSAYHRATDLREMEMLEDGRLRVVIDLDCGCTVTRTIASDRVITDSDSGETFVAGKFICELHTADRETE